LQVVYAVPECYPFAKTGGLGDVVFSLSLNLQKKQVGAFVIMPKYQKIPAYFQQKMQPVASFSVPVSWRDISCQLEKLTYQGLDFYFVSNQHYFSRPALYNHADDAERFVFFSRAVLEAFSKLDIRPDIVHTHDWQTAPVSIFLKTHYQDDPFYKDLKTVFSFHNLEYQGIFPLKVVEDVLGLDKRFCTFEELEYHGNANFLKGGIKYSDQILAPSEEYAQKVQKRKFAKDLALLFQERSEDLTGIVNGVDNKEYNPETDPHLFQNYLRRPEAEKKKLANKFELQKSLGLPQEDVPLLVMVSNLVEHKGIELLLEVMPRLTDEDLQIIILGRGKEKFEQELKNIAWRNPDKFSVNITSNEDLARKIYAAGDFFLHPSKSEPCGIFPLIALQYLTIPIIRRMGGLCQEIKPYSEKQTEGFGFVFDKYSADSFYDQIIEAISRYQKKETWQGILANAADYQYSWQQTTEKYLQVYQDVQNQ